MEQPLYPDDVVSLKADSTQYAVVERTHDEVETHKPFPGQTEHEPIDRDTSISPAEFSRFMRDGIPPKGTVLLRWQSTPGLRLTPTSKLNLIDRSLLVGDVVKRGVSESMSGVVINTHTKCSLQAMCDLTYQGSQSPRTLKGLLPPGRWDAEDRGRSTSGVMLEPSGRPEVIPDVPASELRYSEFPTADDLVVYGDWIGRIEAVTNNIRVKLLDNCVVEVNDEVGEHPNGYIGDFFVGDIFKTKKGDLRRGRWIFGHYNPNTPPIGTVVDIRTISADVTWLHRRIGCFDEQEPPALLEAAELESSKFRMYDRTRKPLRRQDSPRASSSTVSYSEFDVRLNLRVRFHDLAGARVKYATASNPNRVPKLERHDNLGYDLNVFDVTAFHTDVTVQWQDLSMTVEKSIDLVPDANIDDEHAAWPGEVAHSLELHAVPGLAHIRKPAKVGVVQSVHAAERMARMRWSDLSFVHYSADPDEEDGPEPIVLFAISPSGNFVEEDVSLYDIDAPAALNVRRGDIVLINNSEYNPLPGPSADATWLGEIVDTPPDGTFLVRLGAATETRDVVLTRQECVVAVRSDGTGLPDEWDDQAMDVDEVDSELEEALEDAEMEATYLDENGREMDVEDVEDEDWESEDDGDVPMSNVIEVTPPTSHSRTPPSEKANLNGEVVGPSGDQPVPPPPYAVLDGPVPTSHHYEQTPLVANATLLKRVQREHKILQNQLALPQGVFVRTWESRMDLLRVLILGPTETPYENAPFVVDFHLPATYPSTPPDAFFHSWPSQAHLGTLGRVNPNLYEDGKICLSLLGTWEGGQGEGWSAAKSTLLQVVVSILGLVLVRQPYYNEAGYELLVDSEASKLPSALYSERVYLRARGFIITALSNMRAGLEGLEDVVDWTYRDARGPKLLHAAIENVGQVLGRSEAGEKPDGLTTMSKGATIPLKRVLEELRQLLP